MNHLICPVTAADAEAVSALVQRSFIELAAQDWQPQAVESFLKETTPAQMRVALENPAYAASALDGAEMIGFILLPRPSLLAMLFVAPHFLRRGIGRALWEHARATVEENHPQAKTVELNSTPYARPFYRSIGFAPISAEFEKAGCRATRMAIWLPARALGAELLN